MASKRDYYSILGISTGATKEQIKKAYRKLVLRYHPDRNRSPDAEEMFKEITVAYMVLSDDGKRQTYDSIEIVNDIPQTVVSSDIVTNKRRRISIVIDKSLCLAFSSCETLAPKVFYVDRKARINPKASVLDEEGADFETILDAAQTCPTRAIKIIDRDTGEQIYP